MKAKKFFVLLILIRIVALQKIDWRTGAVSNQLFLHAVVNLILLQNTCPDTRWIQLVYLNPKHSKSEKKRLRLTEIKKTEVRLTI